MESTASQGQRPSGRAQTLALALGWLALVPLAVWAVAALCFDVRIAWLRYPAAGVFVLSVLAVLFLVQRSWMRLLGCAACCGIVLLWWFSLQPSNQGQWQADVSRTAWAERHGNQVVVHDVRNCDYRAEFDYTCRWETRSFDLSQLRGVDAYVVYWGSPWIAHTMLSFQFGENAWLPFSIETRKQVGQSYSALLGFFRQYELIYIASDERDLVRLRTNYRKGEDVYLYHLTADPVRARERFLEYLGRINDLHETPEWYNALTRNCTTSIFSQRVATAGAVPVLPELNWRVFLNGKLDEMAYRDGLLAGGLPFEELKRRAYINPAAQAADQDPDFSRKIREGRPGFQFAAPAGAARTDHP